MLKRASTTQNRTQHRFGRCWTVHRSARRFRRPSDSQHPEDYGIDSAPLVAGVSSTNVPPGIGQSCPTDAEALLVSAFDFAFQLHEGQFRASGDPYIVHPVAVADLLRDIGASAPVIAAGFLHDVVEDTDVTPDQIEEHFGS